jgi:hypothetical protein
LGKVGAVHREIEGQAMTEKRFFWMKQRTDYFLQPYIDYLMAQGRYDFILLTQMLCLMTANTGGIMADQIGCITVPYTVDKIARDSKHFSKDTVGRALQEFMKIGFIVR